MKNDPQTPTQEQWSDVDQAADTGAFAKYLDTIRSIDTANAYKQRSLEVLGLRPGMRALDVGCGTGDDARRLAEIVAPTGSVLGVDFSAAMVEESARRWSDLAPALTFAVGDVHRLELPDAGFDAARADRMFQHLADPRQALAEMIRVVRPGGRVSIADPDWGTYAMDIPDTPSARAYLNFAQGQAKNPWIGRQLYGMFRAAGLTDIDLTAYTMFVRDYHVLEKLGNLDAGFIAATASGVLTEAEVAALKADMLERHRLGRFLMTVNIFIVTGTKPV